MADAGNARNRRMAMGWEMAASMALGAPIASALYQNVIPLRGSLGDWLFWPEKHVPALGRLWPSMVVHRIVFASVTLVLTLPICSPFSACCSPLHWFGACPCFLAVRRGLDDLRGTGCFSYGLAGGCYSFEIG